MGKSDLSSAGPAYRQVVNGVISSIACGDYTPGARMPNISELASTYGVAEGTVKRALAELRDRAVIVTRQGTGTFVRADLDVETLPDLTESIPLGGPAGLTEVLGILGEIRDRLTAIENRLPAKG